MFIWKFTLNATWNVSHLSFNYFAQLSQWNRTFVCTLRLRITKQGHVFKRGRSEEEDNSLRYFGVLDILCTTRSQTRSRSHHTRRVRAHASNWSVRDTIALILLQHHKASSLPLPQSLSQSPSTSTIAVGVKAFVAIVDLCFRLPFACVCVSLISPQMDKGFRQLHFEYEIYLKIRIRVYSRSLSMRLILFNRLLTAHTKDWLTSMRFL